MRKLIFFIKNYYFPVIIIVLFVLYKIDSYRLVKEDAEKSINLKGEYICVSLNQLIDDINFKKLQLKKDSIDSTSNDTIPSANLIEPSVDSLYGISWIEGYLVDTENKDIIIVGKSISSRPACHAEDIIINLQNVFDSLQPPYCSLDPKSENIKKMQGIDKAKLDFEELVMAQKEAIGGQMVVVGGVPKNSHHAKVMIYADYDMKKISQGLLKAKGIPSTIDISVIESEKNSTSDSFLSRTWSKIRMFFERLFKSVSENSKSSMSRFWFHIKKNDNSVYPNFIESDNILFIRECPVVVLTEKQAVDKEGNLSDDTKADDEVAEIFAMNFSHNFSGITTTNCIFAELENLFRIQALFRALKYNNVINKLKSDVLSKIKGNYASGDYLPESLPGLVNYKITQAKSNDGYTNSQLYMVSGGVSMETVISGKSFSVNKNMVTLKRKILAERFQSKTSFWTTIIE